MIELSDYLLRSGAGLALFYAFYWAFLRREAFHRLNRIYLLAAAGLAMALPLVRMTSPFFTKIVAPGAAVLPGPQMPAGAPAAPAAGPSLLLAVYLAGAGLVFLRFLARLAALMRSALRCGCERRAGLRVVVCAHRGEPFSFFNFIFLDRSNIPERDMDRIVAHELAHVRGLHSLDIILSECLAIVQWFNPFVWLYKRSLRETHEYLADRAVIAQGCSLARYQLLLVEQHVGREALALASHLRTSQIKRRLLMLSRKESQGWARWKPIWLLPLAVVLVLAFAESRTVVQPGPVQETMKPQEAAKPETPVSDGEMLAALRAKFAKLEAMKKENGAKIEELKAAYEKAATEEERIEVKALLKKEHLKSQEIQKKGQMLSMKKLELAIARETDPAKKADLEKKLRLMEGAKPEPGASVAAKKYEEVIKKIELMIAQETDPAKRDALKKKLEEVQHAAQIEATTAAELEKKNVEKK
ncbi:MAG: hypothetical protein JW742_04695 [Candidatus Aminicenantes bacterium]|nr:hypothetical protein [Candidatus Aminicenantes bacterium]